ncbi:UvrD-helicase domain-containing protein [Bradyrhizobium sp. HKCCYLRH3061]|uniref:UvrD-helicase domain-containing protein n=1 Tax=Bradyrhizobium sp. HKCCYLRH3061 TaxID=3420734 RepID=UPI003EBD594B
MTLTDLIDALFPPGHPKRPTPAQEAILRHPQGPAWVLAGPGSGKTEVLTLFVLRLLYVEQDPVQSVCTPPEAIFVTTFTEKAARNLEDRISHYRNQLVVQRPALAAIDISKLHLGTLHGLCNDLLQEHRAPNYQNVRLMDELESSMFVYEHISIVDTPNPTNDRPFWTHFSYLFSPREWQTTWAWLPSKWNMTAALVKLFNRIVEDRISVAAMRAAGGQWLRLADLYEEYRTKLEDEHRCDFSHLQGHFLEFLQTPLGRRFRDGNVGEGAIGISWILVDEYQDTNLVQEEIYLTLANRAPHNIVVVGDDDQALYRFRGGSVECMVTFDQACATFLGVQQTGISRFPLVANFRSHASIVTFCNNYISAFPSMAIRGARVPNKPDLVPRSSIGGTYPAVGQLRAASMDAVAARFADTVQGLVANGIVQDYSQCCLLLKSTKETPNNALKYVAALQAQGIPVYNPRNKAFLEQEEVLGLLGALLAITDGQGRHVPQRPQELATLIANCRTEYVSQAAGNPRLSRYVSDARANLAAKPGAFLTANLQELVYYLLSMPPFDGWSRDPVRRVRLARITALVESFASMPVPGHPNAARGRLRSSNNFPGDVLEQWSYGFYHLFFGYLARVGIDEEEDEDIIAPLGMVPVMTMHQAKGLQFPFVFVGHMGEDSRVSVAHQIETQLSQFPSNPARSFAQLPELVRAELDLIRQYYVAFSRAQWALILVGTNQQFAKGRIPCGPNRNWLSNRVLPL